MLLKHLIYNIKIFGIEFRQIRMDHFDIEGNTNSELAENVRQSEESCRNESTEADIEKV